MSGAPIAVVVAVAVLLAAAGCSASRDDQVVVFAASSLADVFARIEVEFEAGHPGVDIVVSAGGSSTLVAQLVDGAPADVLATADPSTMATAEAGVSMAGRSRVFAENSLAIAVEPGNPLEVGGLADLEDVPIVVLAAVEVPAGTYAQDVLACEGVELDVASFEQSVRAASTKVALGEADAAIVYRTDIGEGLDAVEIDSTCNVTAQYPIVAVTDEQMTAEFVAFVLGDEGAAALRDAGFVVP